MGLEGLEPVNVTKRKGNELRDVEDVGGAESGAVETEKAPIDPDLARLIDTWPNLPEAIRAGIVAMVNTAIESR